MPANKIVMGLASYGRTFALTGSGDAPGLVSFDGERPGQAALVRVLVGLEQVQQ